MDRDPVDQIAVAAAAMAYWLRHHTSPDQKSALSAVLLEQGVISPDESICYFACSDVTPRIVVVLNNSDTFVIDADSGVIISAE